MKLYNRNQFSMLNESKQNLEELVKTVYNIEEPNAKGQILVKPKDGSSMPFRITTKNDKFIVSEGSQERNYLPMTFYKVKEASNMDEVYNYLIKNWNKSAKIQGSGRTPLNEDDDSKKDLKIEINLEESIREYGKVTKELDALQKSIEDKVKSLSEQQTKLFDNIFEEMKKSKKNILVVDKIVAEVKIVKGTSGKKNPKYKEAFTAALSKVNDATKKVLESILEANTTTTPGKPESDQLNIKITESVISDTWVKFKEFVNNIYKKIKSAVSDQTEAVSELQKIIE